MWFVYFTFHVWQWYKWLTLAGSYFRVYSKSWLSDFSRKSGDMFTSSLCGAMGTGFIGWFTSSVSTVQNVTIRFNLYAGNMLCSLVKKYARDKIWLIFFFFSTGTCSLYRQILSELIFRVAKEVLPFVALSQVTWARRSCHIWSEGPGSQNGKWDVNWF